MERQTCGPQTHPLRTTKVGRLLRDRERALLRLLPHFHIDRVAAAFSKVVVVPALAKQSGDAPGAWLAPPNTCAPERPATAGSTASNATASDAALARLAALRAAGSLSAAEFARAAAKIHGNNRRPRRRLANTRS